MVIFYKCGHMLNLGTTTMILHFNPILAKYHSIFTFYLFICMATKAFENNLSLYLTFLRLYLIIAQLISIMFFQLRSLIVPHFANKLKKHSLKLCHFLTIKNSFYTIRHNAFAWPVSNDQFHKV